jgi:hypothetical protein
MDLQLEGIIRELLPLQEGEGRNGRWKKQLFVMETQGGQYPKQVCLMVWGDRVDQFNLKVGDQIVASIDIESREFNGRWYTDVKAWKVEKKGTAGNETSQPVEGGSSVPYIPEVPARPASPDINPELGNQEDDDLPF